MTRYDKLVKGAQHELNQYPNPRADDGADGLLVAQAQATLALAEQQRVANLIAIWGTTDVDGEVAGQAWDQITAALDV